MKASLAALSLFALASCGHGEHGPHARRDERAHLGGGVVARIGDVALTADDVVGEARAHGGTAREALDRLIAAHVLAKEAQRRGYGRRADVVAAVDRVAVQELLARQVEDEVPESSVTDADVAAAYAAAGTRFRVPPQRGSVHVLVRIPRDAPEARSDAARALAERARQDFSSSSDPDAVLARWSAMSGGPFELRAERVPDTPPDGQLVAEYLTALFAIDASHLPAVAPAPVRTEFGWHAIVLVDVVPGHETPLAEVATELRTEVTARRRRARLDALLADLARRTPPVADPEGVRHALAESP